MALPNLSTLAPPPPTHEPYTHYYHVRVSLRFIVKIQFGPFISIYIQLRSRFLLTTIWNWIEVRKLDLLKSSKQTTTMPLFWLLL